MKLVKTLGIGLGVFALLFAPISAYAGCGGCGEGSHGGSHGKEHKGHAHAHGHAHEHGMSFADKASVLKEAAAALKQSNPELAKKLNAIASEFSAGYSN